MLSRIVRCGISFLILFATFLLNLAVPVPGLPLQITRTYDSRGRRTNDFGVGWFWNGQNRLDCPHHGRYRGMESCFRFAIVFVFARQYPQKRAMTPAQQHATLGSAFRQVAFDNLTRQLYATDASHYQIEPIAVAFPRDARQASSIIEAAAQAGVSVIPRGAGTSLSGGAIGEGVVVDFSRYSRQISDFDAERRTVRDGAGVVLDQLNAFLRPEGFCFWPDVATSARATIGGMIANNSSGAHVPIYGTTADHVTELEVIFRDARVLKVGPAHETLPKQRELMENMALFNDRTGLSAFDRTTTEAFCEKYFPGFPAI